MAKKRGLFKFFFYLIIIFLVLIVVQVKNPVFTSAGKNSTPDVSADQLKEYVTTLVGVAPYRSSQEWASLDKAADWIKSVWTAQGYKVEEQTFEVQGHRARNLIVRYIPEGVDPTTARLVVGAHYDVCMNLPGADDNASGVAGLLELTRLVSKFSPKPQRPIEFVAWTLEEPPFYDTEWMGSYVHAKKLREENASVALALSMEMIGFYSDAPNSQNFPVDVLKGIYPSRADFIAVIGNNEGWSIVRKAKQLMIENSAIPVYSMNAFGIIPGIDYSDHRSFWAFNYPGIMVTDTSFYRNKNYHMPTDTPDTLNYQKMAQVVQGVYGILVGF